MKSTEVAMQDAVLLRQELHQCHTSNKHQEGKKNMTRAFIQDRGSLTGSEGRQKLIEREAIQESSSRPRRLIRRSSCNQEGHNRLKCPAKLPYI